MRIKRFALLAAFTVAHAAGAAAGGGGGGGGGANPNAPYCYSGGTVGAIGGGGGGGGGGSAPICTYADPATSFGAGYTNTRVSGLTQVACAANAPTIVAEHLFASSHALSSLQPPFTDDDKFLQKAGETPAAIIAIDTSDALNDFSTMPDVPPNFTSGPGAGRPMGCPSTVMESRLHRAWPAFGNSYYYGDPQASAVSDPVGFRYFACWQPITLGLDKAYLYRRWGNPQTPEAHCETAVGNKNSFDYHQCVWCLKQSTQTVPDPQSWNGTKTTLNTQGSGHGYYITSNARTASNNSVFWSGVVIDYPPKWIPLYWTGKFMANNAMTDLTGTNFLFPLRREVTTINNTMPVTACGTAIDSGGNGMHPTCGRSNPYKGDSSFNSIWNFLDNKFKPFVDGTAVGTDLPLAGAIAESAETYKLGGFQPNGNTAGWCSTCARNHVIVISGGETCHDQGTGAIDSLYYDSSVSCSGACSYTAPGCGNRNGTSNNTCGGSSPVWPPQVAAKVSTSDMLPATPGRQTITVDAIAIGGNQTALQDAARGSGGTFVDASQDPNAIPEALFSVLTGLVRASVTTASTPLNTVQAQGGAQEELVPQFIPLDQESIYDGHLYKLYFFSEFAAGCMQQGDVVNFPDHNSSACTIRCPCLGGTCNGRFSVDANMSFVLHANEGTLRVLTYGELTAFHAANHRLPTSQEMIAYPLFAPVWDMASVMADSVRQPWHGRRAYTVIDSNSDGQINRNDGLMQISAASSGVTDAVAQALLPYLGVVGTNLCTQIAGLNLPGVTGDPAVTGNYLPCAKAVLNYALGQDLFDSNRNSRTDDNRTPILGDIYHSTPIDIGPPVQEQFCDFNLRRCAATLFNVGNQRDSTSHQALEYPTTYYDDHGVLTTGAGIDAYQAWVNDQIYNQKHPQVRVFGANDGWIHAVQYSCYTGVGGVNREATYYGGPGRTGCMAGSAENGSELWAFISPDLLAKLPLMLLRKHQVFNDLTPLVRDIYHGDNVIKRQGDFRTVAIFGERNGGTHWSALDVTNPTAPRFLWMFPEIGSVDELRAGLTWGEYFPGAPPIVPIRMSTSLAGSPTHDGDPFHETWVTVLPGGYDRYGARGHGFWMLDAYTGEKYWEAFDAPGMDFSFAAYPALVAWGTSEAAPSGVLNHGFFDTAVIGDTGGTLWVARFNELPVRSVNAHGDNLATNWAVARAFRQFDRDDPGNTNVYMMKNRTPFFSMPSIGRMPDSGFMRAFIGSGDRGNVDDQYLGECRATNMLACGKQGVVTLAQRDMAIGSSSLRRAFQSYDGSYSANVRVDETLTYSSASATQCTPAGGVLNACLRSSVGTAATPLAPNAPQAACVHTASGEVCSKITPQSLAAATAFNPSTGANGTTNAYSTAGNGYYSRFFGVTLFKSGVANRALFNTSTASTYDSGRTTEAPGAACSGSTSTNGLCNLYPSGLMASYAYPETPASFRQPQHTNGSSDGFFFYYPNIDERTATNPLLAHGCLLWGTVQPTSPCETDADCAAFSAGVAGGGTVEVGQCNTAAKECERSTQCNVVGGSSAAHFYQLNAVLGTTDCPLTSSATPRFTTGTILPPQPPILVISVNPQGQKQESVVGIPGKEYLMPPRPGGGQLFKTFFGLELSRPLHSCRHQGNCP